MVPPVPGPWDESLNLRAGLGYRDNLLLSNAAREGSYAVLSSLEAVVTRLPLDGKQFYLFLNAEDSQYPQGISVDHERFLIALSQFKIDLARAWTAGMDLQYLYQDQVIDLSTTETNLGPARVLGQGTTGRPSLKWSLENGAWLESSFGITRQYFRSPLDNYWEGGPRIVIGYDYGFKSSVSLSYEIIRRDYDTRDQVALDGTTLTGMPLRFHGQEWEAVLRHNVDSERHWRTTTRMGVQLNRDNGPGFFDYDRYQVSEQLRYVAKDWEFKGQAKVANYTFQNQILDSNLLFYRRKTLFTFTVGAERNLTKRIKLFAEGAYERSASNRLTDSYRSSRIIAGIDLSVF